MNATRKQRYFLDFDDVMDPSFLNPNNVNNIVLGMNKYGVIPLNPNVGGMGTNGSGLVSGNLLGWNGSKVVDGGITPTNSYTKTQSDNFMAGKTTPATVLYITVTGGGSGYVVAPTVSFTGGSGSGATATAVITGGVVTSVILTNGGSGYTAPPTVVFGTGAASATAVIDSTSLQRYEINWADILNRPALFATDWALISNKPSAFGTQRIYLPGPLLISGPSAAVTFGAAGAGSGATGTVGSMGLSGVIGTVTVTNPGTTGYTTPVVTFGSGAATATANVDPSSNLIISITITNWGSGYSIASPPTVTITDSTGPGAGATATCTVVNGVISITVGANGSGYSLPPSVSFSGGGVMGSGAAAVATLGSGGTSGEVISYTITAPGSGYTSPPTVHVTSLNVVATGHVVLSGTTVGSIVIDTPGFGYGTGATPTVTITGTGSGATATSTTNDGQVTSVMVGSAGTGYVAQPNITITVPVGSGPGSGAIVVPILSMVGFGASTGSPLLGVQLLAGGSGYLGGTGSGTIGCTVTDSTGVVTNAATVIATVTAGVVTAVALENAGAGYRNFTTGVGYFSTGTPMTGYSWITANLATGNLGVVIPSNASGVILYSEMFTGTGGFVNMQLMTRANANSAPITILTHSHGEFTTGVGMSNSAVVTVPIDSSLTIQHQLFNNNTNSVSGSMAIYVVGYTIG